MCEQGPGIPIPLDALSPTRVTRLGDRPYGSVIAPRSAPVTSRAYLASTPLR